MQPSGCRRLAWCRSDRPRHRLRPPRFCSTAARESSGYGNRTFSEPAARLAGQELSACRSTRGSNARGDEDTVYRTIGVDFSKDWLSPWPAASHGTQVLDWPQMRFEHRGRALPIIAIDMPMKPSATRRLDTERSRRVGADLHARARRGYAAENETFASGANIITGRTQDHRRQCTVRTHHG